MKRSFQVRARVVSGPESVRVVLFGLGPIGCEVAREIAARGAAFRIVGAVDRAASLVGKKLSEVAGIESDVEVVGSLGEWRGEAEVAILTTSSRLGAIYEQLEACAERRLSVVSSAEELFYPGLEDAELAGRIDSLAIDSGVSILGAGINPGYLMDVLPTVLAMATGSIRSVACHRVVDVSMRRVPLQRKVGAGLTAEEFNRLADEGKLGHVGLVQSVAYLAGELGFAIDEIRELLEPAISRQGFELEGKKETPGKVAGIDHQAWGLVTKEPVIHLHLQMYVGAFDPRDTIVLEGTPRIECTLRPCVAGDRATAALLVQLAGHAAGAEPGLHFVHDLGLRPWATRYQIERVG